MDGRRIRELHGAARRPGRAPRVAGAAVASRPRVASAMAANLGAGQGAEVPMGLEVHALQSRRRARAGSRFLARPFAPGRRVRCAGPEARLGRHRHRHRARVAYGDAGLPQPPLHLPRQGRPQRASGAGALRGAEAHRGRAGRRRRGAAPARARHPVVRGRRRRQRRPAVGPGAAARGLRRRQGVGLLREMTILDILIATLVLFPRLTEWGWSETGHGELADWGVPLLVVALTVVAVRRRSWPVAAAVLAAVLGLGVLWRLGVFENRTVIDVLWSMTRGPGAIPLVALFGVAVRRWSHEPWENSFFVRLGTRLARAWHATLLRWPRRPVWIAAAAVGALYFCVSLLRHWAFESHGYDLGIFTNAIWNLTHGNGYVS